MTLIDQLPPWRSMPPAQKAIRRAQLAALVSAPRRRIPGVLRWATVGVALCGVFTGGVATATMLQAPATVRDEVRCYSAARLDESDSFTGVTLSGITGRDEASDAAGDAVRLCAAMWRQGVLAPEGSARMPSDTPGMQAPSLVGCTLDKGIAAVFPGDADVCARLGLPKLAVP
jgi:hypothetical protein